MTQISARSNVKGITLMTLGMFSFGSADTIAKFMTGGYHPMQIAGIRQSGLLIGVLLFVLLTRTNPLRTKKPKLQVFRGLCATVSGVLFVVGLRYIPLTDASSIAFVAPFFVTILGAVFLGEYVGVRRIVAITMGFVGTLVIIRPGFDSFHPAYLIVVFSAFLFATRQVVSRSLAGVDSTVTTVAFTAITSVCLLAVVQPFVWKPVAQEDILLFAIYAACSGFGELLVIKALEISQAVVVAPLQYTMIFWTTGYGYLIFGNLPDMFTIIGAGIIVASGLYTLLRTKARVPRVGPF